MHGKWGELASRQMKTRKLRKQNAPFRIPVLVHVILECGDLARIWRGQKVLFVEGARSRRQVFVELPEILAVLVDVEIVHGCLRHIQHVQLGGQLLGKRRFARRNRALDRDNLRRATKNTNHHAVEWR